MCWTPDHVILLVDQAQWELAWRGLSQQRFSSRHFILNITTGPRVVTFLLPLVQSTHGKKCTQKSETLGGILNKFVSYGICTMWLQTIQNSSVSDPPEEIKAGLKTLSASGTSVTTSRQQSSVPLTWSIVWLTIQCSPLYLLCSVPCLADFLFPLQIVFV